MADAVALVPTEGVRVADIATALVGLGCVGGPAGRLVRTFYDTFDGRFFRAGLVVEHERVDDRWWLRVRRLGETTALAQAAVSRVVGPVAALGDRRVQRLLAEPSGGRALLPLVHTEGEVHRYAMVDELDKTTVRVSVTTVEASDARGVGDVRVGGAAAARPGGRTRHLLEPVITVAPVRGHERAHERLVEAISLRLGQRPAAEPLRRAAGAAGVALGADPSDRSVPLVAGEPAAAAVAAMLRRAADVLDANTPGVVARTDDEFLHDFRVTLRATRAVVDAATDVLEPADRAALGDALRALMRLTSPVRDLDVLRQAWTDDAALAVLLPALEEEYAPVHAALVAALEGEQLPALLALLCAARPAGGSAPTTAAWVAVAVPEGHARLQRRLRRVRQPGGGGRAGAGTDEALHAARKAAKRLRYLLDAFAPLDDDGALRPLRRDLRRLQQDLGEFQDGVVTVAAIERLAPRAPGLSAAALMELGRRAEQERQAARAAAARVVSGDDHLMGRRRLARRLAGLAGPAGTAPVDGAQASS